ncbi:ATP-binding cassette sub-family A member 3-like, partial [Contarinia nasturtii]|uniref:ATP-binding cassette sub-family A member 3-like n=1 Tax=Contarinia nasturtii TaxID=265458 RepID=UPI0012D39E47
MKSNSWIQRILSSKNDKNNANDQFKTVESVKLPSNKNGTVEPKRKTAEIFDKFCLLMWKNCLIQYRHKTQTAVLILIPILFTANLPFIRSLIRPEVNLQKTNFNAFNINKIPKFDTKIDNHLMNFSLVYSPKNIVLAELLGIVARDLGLSPFHGVDRPEQVENITARHEFLAGVVFDHDANITKLPKNLVYTLRFPSELRNALDPLIFHWQTNMQYPLFSGGGPRKKSSDTGGAPNYFSEGFLSIQNAIANAFMTLSSNDSAHTSNIQMQRFPYPPYTNDILFDGLEGSVGLFIMLSFVYSIISTVRFIAVEKEKQLKEIMKIMGMPVWLHWTSWFVRTMTFLLISNTFLVALLKTQICDSSFAVFTNSNSFAIWILLLVYSVAITTYCFMLSVLFSKANTAATVSGLIWFVSYMPFVFLTINHVNVPTLVQWLACVSPNVAMSYGFKTIVDFERNGHGLQWSNFWSYPITENNIAVGTTIYFMLMTSFVLLLMALYIEKVYPGEYGVPEKWNFFCNCDFWFGNHDLLIENDSLHDDEVNNDFESDSTKCMSEKWNWVFKNDSWHNNNEKEYPNFEDEPLNCEAG